MIRGAMSFKGYVNDNSEKWAVSPCACTMAHPLPCNAFLGARPTPDFEAIVDGWASREPAADQTARQLFVYGLVLSLVCKLP